MDRLRGKLVHKGEETSGEGLGDGLVALHLHCVATIYLKLISVGGVTGLALKGRQSLDLDIEVCYISFLRVRAFLHLLASCLCSSRG